jgi:hypothetical protein
VQLRPEALLEFFCWPEGVILQHIEARTENSRIKSENVLNGEKE